MKPMRMKRLLALTLCLFTVGALFAAVIPVSADGVKEHSVQNGTGTREPIRVTGAYSYRVSVKHAFTGFAFAMPTWNKTDSYATLYLYKWQGSYEATVAGEPLASKEFNPLSDNQKHWVEFDAQPAGEYLFHIADGGADVGVWTNSAPTDSKGFLYIDGKEKRGEPELYIRFAEAVSDPFDTCAPSQDLLIPQEPYATASGSAVFDVPSSLGVRLNAAAPVSGLEVKFGTYHLADLEISVSAYAWKGSYEATVAEAPLSTSRTVLVDNMFAEVRFDKLPAGDYLFLMHDMTASPAVYIYQDATGFEGALYTDGVLQQDAGLYPYIRLLFAAEAEDYFLPVTVNEDVPDGTHKTPAPYVIPEDSLIYTHPVMPDTWVFTDGLGRVSLTNKEVGDLKTDKTLAMFYWTWHVSGGSRNNPANVQELSEKYPEAMRDYDHSLWAELGERAFFWNEPIYGYYRGDDAWVQRRQGELLANAGVDVVFTDNTNGTSTWRNSYTVLMETWSNAMKDGVMTPKVSFMLPFWDKDYTRTQIQFIYQDIFRKNKWPETWFYWDEKPMLMAMKDSFDPTSSMVDKEIADFFTFRAGQPDYVVNKTDYSSWGWLSMYPQAVYYKNSAEQRDGVIEQMTVGVAQNHDYEQHLLAAMSGNHIAGRSYSSDFKDRYAKEGSEASKWGYNFAEQWNYALEADPKVVFVTGWNEWTAGRYEIWPEGSDSAVENAFPDQFIDEFSRDIEPTKGALKDHYYYQLVNFVRQYKGARPIPTPGALKTIDLGGSIDQWKGVEPYYAAYIGNTDDRNAAGYGDLVYTETSGRNDIIGAQIARDDQYVYFLVECAEEITPYTDALWMNLYIDTDQEKQGWNTFDFVVNKSAASEKTLVLEKFTAADSYASEKVADVEYRVDGRYMTVKIAKSDLGLTGNDYTVNFAWTDNVHDEGDYNKFSGDIMDFYISGDVAPGGRFKFSYISTSENAAGGSEETSAPAESVTPDTQAPTTSAPAESESEPTDTGCASSTVGVAAVLTAAAAAVALGKRRED